MYRPRYRADRYFIMDFLNPHSMGRETCIQNPHCKLAVISWLLSSCKSGVHFDSFCFWVNSAAEFGGSGEALRGLLSVAGTLQICELTQRLMD